MLMNIFFIVKKSFDRFIIWKGQASLSSPLSWWFFRSVDVYDVTDDYDE